VSATSEREKSSSKDNSGVVPAEGSAIRRAEAIPTLPAPGQFAGEDDSYQHELSVTLESGDAEESSVTGRRSLPSLPPPVARFGKYDILGRIAVGGMAEIFLAHEALPGGALRKSALKIIKRAPASEKDSLYFEELFLREGRTVVQLAHPNICHVYDIGREGEQFFIAMEWIEGRSLQDLVARLARTGELIPPAIAAGIAAQVASALDYAHTARDARNKSLHVVHRDVNPQNIMLRFDGAVKLVDFGVAQVSAEVDSRANTVKGKPSYMAPEQLRNEAVDARTDVFALGVCLYEMLSGLRLHKRPTLRETMLAVIQEPAPALSRFVPGIPEELDAIVQRALQKQPQDRYQSAGELQAALESYLAMRGEVGSARRIGELMSRLYPNERDFAPQVDMSREATACFSAPVQEPRALQWLKRQSRTRLLVLAAGSLCALALLGWLLRAPSAPAPAAQATMPAAPVRAQEPAAPAPPQEPQLGPAEKSALTPAPKESARKPEAPVDPVPRKRRRSSPGFVADPGF
jgi:serine/threonine-protein kinase